MVQERHSAAFSSILAANRQQDPARLNCLQVVLETRGRPRRPRSRGRSEFLRPRRRRPRLPQRIVEIEDRALIDASQDCRHDCRGSAHEFGDRIGGNRLFGIVPVAQIEPLIHTFAFGQSADVMNVNVWRRAVRQHQVDPANEIIATSGQTGFQVAVHADRVRMEVIEDDLRAGPLMKDPAWIEDR